MRKVNKIMTNPYREAIAWLEDENLKINNIDDIPWVLHKRTGTFLRSKAREYERTEKNLKAFASGRAGISDFSDDLTLNHIPKIMCDLRDLEEDFKEKAKKWGKLNPYLEELAWFTDSEKRKIEKLMELPYDLRLEAIMITLEYATKCGICEFSLQGFIKGRYELKGLIYETVNHPTVALTYPFHGSSGPPTWVAPRRAVAPIPNAKMTAAALRSACSV